CSGSSLGAFLERLVNVDLRCLPRRRETEQQTGGERYRQCESEHSVVEPCLIESRNVERGVGGQEVYSPEGQQYACCSAQQRKQHALGEELPDNSRAACTQ